MMIMMSYRVKQFRFILGWCLNIFFLCSSHTAFANDTDLTSELKPEDAQLNNKKKLTNTSVINIQKESNEANNQYHSPPAESQIPHDKYGDDVRLGQKIFTQTTEYASRYSGNKLNCSNCHMDAGRRPHSAPLWAAYGMYPAYREKNDRNSTLEERIQECFRFSLNGLSPALDAPEIRALVSYMHFLSQGVPIGIEMPGRGYPQIIKTGRDPNPQRGAKIYNAKCSFCHGTDGEGKIGGDGKQIFPPLWGINSYNKGAGLAKNNLLAGFIKANMPLGQEWTLSDQEALDLAAYINLQIRPWDPRKGMIKGLFE